MRVQYQQIFVAILMIIKLTEEKTLRVKKDTSVVAIVSERILSAGSLTMAIANACTMSHTGI